MCSGYIDNGYYVSCTDVAYVILCSRYVFCEKCFDELPKPMVDLSDEITGNPLQLPKSAFIKIKVRTEIQLFMLCLK